VKLENQINVEVIW